MIEIQDDTLFVIIILLILIVFVIGLLTGYYLSYKEVAEPLMECARMIGYVQALNINFGGL